MSEGKYREGIWGYPAVGIHNGERKATFAQTELILKNKTKTTQTFTVGQQWKTRQHTGLAAKIY